MGINRRQFSLLMTGALVSPALLARQSPGQPLFASAATDNQGQHYLQLVSDQGKELLSHPLLSRAHHVAAHPSETWLAAVARRPGTYIDVLDYRQNTLLHRVESAADRHFYGHAIFSRNGRYLISTENQVSDGSGRIVVRDCQQQFNIVADHPSYGIGPHELALLTDDNTLVVANGGILTHPDKGRDKLNLDSMQPSLAYIDLVSGALLEQVTLPPEMHQLSIRHLDVNATGTVAIALQYQGPKYDDVPLVALHRRGNAIHPLRAPDAINRAMKQYCGSVRFDASGRYVAISSPRGDLITFWDTHTDAFIDQCKTRDGCGLAATEVTGEFLISSGLGRLYRYDLAQRQKQRIPLYLNQPLAWDNHMVSV